ncbi:hypothetical protein K493DRAFT_42201 [Basidiobolus meristosporus CBS 931.73]|uniref:Uncharacterized protein n=1 Tax=Basidiobolus meristosporus CBS 931.73 TaxID=1314790 RepID=A0A1Y1Y3M6_9FUNG|nr:hypothetical protein K493DRAFT_42201 [Basidiobolus meristosporus CBS 931.73]|eukprot:ORX92579.1 hypothetical protein K493DRAFT_42201 [Basidiobolus meristosporus CBS 931.73]
MSTDLRNRLFGQFYLDWRRDQDSSARDFIGFVEEQGRELDLWQTLSQLPTEAAFDIGKQLAKQRPEWTPKLVDLQARQIMSMVWKKHDSLKIESMIESLRALVVAFAAKHVVQSILDTLASFIKQLRCTSAENLSSRKGETLEWSSKVNFHSYASVIPDVKYPKHIKDAKVHTLSRDRILQRIAISFSEMDCCPCRTPGCQRSFLGLLIREMLPFITSLLPMTPESHQPGQRLLSALRYVSKASEEYG